MPSYEAPIKIIPINAASAADYRHLLEQRDIKLWSNLQSQVIAVPDDSLIKTYDKEKIKFKDKEWLQTKPISRLIKKDFRRLKDVHYMDYGGILGFHSFLIDWN